jgi:hypothetical protein
MAVDKSIRKQMAANDTAADSLTTFGASDAADDMEDLQV